MLFTKQTLEGIRDGSVTLAFRRWKRVAVRPGTRLRTAVGLVEIGEVTPITDAEVTADDVRRAGHRSTEAFWAQLARHPGGALHRIGLRYAGADPRVALRERADLTDDELDAVRDRLARIDTAARRGPWTGDVLRLVRDEPGTPAAVLAERLGRDRPAFKRDVRTLKELGLTESLDVGYRLSARGEAVTEALRPTDADGTGTG
ncbi:hypothetical protein [Streptomyces sp. NPDC005955]|uniref:hypothetical protein n=1 Tax=Streptomyces sp. NPDC005955 TaxID=3364738 RepID=UPI003699EA80